MQFWMVFDGCSSFAMQMLGAEKFGPRWAMCLWTWLRLHLQNPWIVRATTRMMCEVICGLPVIMELCVCFSYSKRAGQKTMLQRCPARIASDRKSSTYKAGTAVFCHSKHQVNAVSIVSKNGQVVHKRLFGFYSWGCLPRPGSDPSIRCERNGRSEAMGSASWTRQCDQAIEQYQHCS